jgi:hypothetical protein
MADGGKGSKPRPISISQEEYGSRFDAIFGKKKKDILPEFELNKSTGEVEKVYPENTHLIEIEQNGTEDRTD